MVNHKAGKNSFFLSSRWCAIVYSGPLYEQLAVRDNIEMLRQVLEFSNLLDMGIDASKKHPEVCDLSEKAGIAHKEYIKVAWFGMGASALIGEYIANYLFYTNLCPKVIMNVYRDIPSKQILCMPYDVYIFYSYSGDTLETLEAFNILSRKNPHKNSVLLALSLGGKLESMAKEKGVYHIKLPAGYTSRSHFPYGLAISFSILARILGLEQEIQGLKDPKIRDYITKLNSKESFQKLYELVMKVRDKIVIIAAERTLAAVARRFIAQLNENAKHFATYFEIPEGAHNFIVGLRGLDRKKVFNIILRRNSEEPLMRRYLDVVTNKLAYIDSYIFMIDDEKFSWRTLLIPTIFADVLSVFLADSKNLSTFDIEEISSIKSEL